MTPATERRREQLRFVIAHELAPEPAVQAVIGIGRFACGHKRPDSDVDAGIFYFRVTL
jgi:hypothetical protein